MIVRRARILRRAAALGLLVLALLLVHLAVVQPMVDAWIGASRDIADARARLGTLTTLADAAERLEAALAERMRPPQDGPAYYRASSDTLVAVQVQDRLKAAVDRGGASLTSVRVLPAGEEGPFRRVALRAQVDAPLPVLQRMLHDLESARPYLVLDNLSVRVPGVTAADPVLAVQFDLLAYARIETP
jgi:general secretion pathway protein M